MKAPTLILTFLAIAAQAAEPISPREFTRLKARIEAGHPDEALQRAEELLATQPQDGLAGVLRFEALLALGRASELEAGLIARADASPQDADAIGTLQRLYVRTRNAEGLASLAGRMSRLEGEAAGRRTGMLRVSIGHLCRWEACELAEPALAFLIPGRDEAIRNATLRALQASARDDRMGLLALVPSLIDAPDALLLVSLQVQWRTRDRSLATPLPPQVKGPSDVTAIPKLIREGERLYPEVARRAGITGTVRLQGVVLSSGSVLVTAILASSNPIFNESAIEAFARSAYEPARLAEAVVPCRWEREYEFELR
jgi:TonB family protein